MQRKNAFPLTPTAIWTGAAVLFGVGLAYTPALGNGSTWSLPYVGSTSTSGAAIGATNTGTGYGLSGTAVIIGVNGMGTGVNSCGVQGIGSFFGVTGLCSAPGGYAVYGNASGSGAFGVYGLGATGVNGYSNSGSGSGVHGEGSVGVSGLSHTYFNAGVWGVGVSGANGVNANTDSGYAVYAQSDSGYGVFGYSGSYAGVYGYGSIGVQGYSSSGTNMAGYFGGNVTVTGNLNVYGTINKSAVGFKIDHPQDPAHKYLMHSCVESDEMMNIYRGNVILDSDGKATVIMPAWFQAENRDFSYQLTAIGVAAPSLHIAREIDHNQFEIDGGEAGQKVSWQVTGVRNDAYANAHPLKVEVDKPAKEQGKYLRPEEFGQPKSKGVDYDLVKPVKAPKILPPAAPR